MFDFPPPETPTPPTGRTRHPYFMHEMIRRQAIAAHATHRAIREALSAEPVAPPTRRLLLLGLGTSFHAALAAAQRARSQLPESVEVVARPCFDILEDPAPATPDTTAVVFSASGETALTIAAQRRLHERGTRTILVTAHDGSTSSSIADRVLTSQYADETSWTHTVSFTAGLVAVSVLLDQWSSNGAAVEPAEDAVGEAVTAALATESAVVDLVEPFSDRDRFLFLGSGAAEPAAREAALKFREGTGRFAASVGVEEFLHGVLPSVNEHCAVIGIADTPTERARAEQGLAAAQLVGAKTLLVDTSGGGDAPATIRLPREPRVIPAVLEVIPLQLLAYWLATSEGRNPDVMGLDDPRYLKARSTFGI